MKGNDLTKLQAEERKKQIQKVNYRIQLIIDKRSLDYKGRTTISFDFKKQNRSDKLIVDCIAKEIKYILLNGKKLNNYEKDEFWIYIPTKELKPCNNTIEISHINNYDNTGSGFHRFIDPEDNEVYIHTDFEPYDAHRLFPCFDQPDLKATYILTVTGPKEWKYIHNTKISNQHVEESLITINFEKTKRFSTYIFALVVGPHMVWEDNYKNIPLKLYCRKSLAKYLDPENFFEITKESFNFLEEYFDIPYPYKKYDQIFVPEFNFGAMENVACVTFTEHYIFRSKKLYSQYLSRANTIFHEMVHMWFGNLVTMKWWNDLWLNESFADYLSYYAMSKGKLFPDAFEYQLSRKEWAYMEDQLSTTHPIVGSAEDTADAFANFDGISYSKGAAVLKQLTYFIGEENFRKGIQNYLKKFYGENTVLDDFLNCMSKSSGINIIEWSKKWLETTGVNTLKLCGENNKWNIKQTPSENNDQIRNHAIMYESYKIEGKKVVLNKKNKIIISEENTKFDFEEMGDFVLLNAQDHDYVKIHFRKNDLHFIYNYLNDINDRFTKRIIWGNLWQMVRDNVLSPLWYLKLVKKYSAEEKDPTVLQEQMLQKANGIRINYLIEKYKNEWSKKLYDLAYQNLRKGQNDQFQIAWFNILLGCADTKSQLGELKSILNREINFKNLEIDQDKRWNIITKLCAYGDSDYEKLINKEKLKDPGDLGQKRAFMARVSIPEPQMKKK